jgi:hypothetical protein
MTDEPTPAPVATPEPAPAPAPAPEPTPAPTLITKDPAPAPVAFDATKLTLPEGFKADDPMYKSFTEIFGDDAIAPQDRAQRLLDLHTNSLKAASEAISKTWSDTRAKWVDEVKTDPSIGGDKLTPTLRTIGKMIDGLGQTEAKAFREALEFSGLGDNPAIIRGLAKLAESYNEGSHVSGNPPARPANIAEAFYPSMKGVS